MPMFIYAAWFYVGAFATDMSKDAPMFTTSVCSLIRTLDMPTRFLRKFILWYINKIRPDITVCVKIDQNGNFTWRPTTVCQQVLLGGWIMEWKKMFRTKADDRHQTHVCSPNAFLEVRSVWGLNSRKWIIQNYFTIWELFRTWSELRRTSHTRTSAAYCYQILTFSLRRARPSTVTLSLVDTDRTLSSSLHDLYCRSRDPITVGTGLAEPPHGGNTHATRNGLRFWQISNSENYCGFASKRVPRPLHYLHM